MEGLGLEVEGVGLGFEEGGGGGVVWSWVGCVDAEVALEVCDGSVFFLGVGCCGCGVEESEQDE